MTYKQRRKGKKIDTTTWKHQGSWFAFEIRILDAGNYGSTRKTFEVYSPHFDLACTDSDVNTATENLQAAIIKETQPKFEPTLIVEFERTNDGYRNSAGREDLPNLLATQTDPWNEDEPTNRPELGSWKMGFEVEVEAILLYETGEKAQNEDGIKVLTKSAYRDSYHPHEREMRFGVKDNAVVTRIPDTPENRAALQEIFNSIEELRRRLDVFFAPNKIQKNLKLITANGVKYLPMAPTETKS